VPVQIWFLAVPLRSGRRRVARCLNECPRRQSDAAAGTSAQQNS
jgi:hypothetical protein